jgi:hypothetical protein
VGFGAILNVTVIVEIRMLVPVVEPRPSLRGRSLQTEVRIKSKRSYAELDL